MTWTCLGFRDTGIINVYRTKWCACHAVPSNMLSAHKTRTEVVRNSWYHFHILHVLVVQDMKIMKGIPGSYKEVDDTSILAGWMQTETTNTARKSAWYVHTLQWSRSVKYTSNIGNCWFGTKHSIFTYIFIFLWSSPFTETCNRHCFPTLSLSHISVYCHPTNQ